MKMETKESGNRLANLVSLRRAVEGSGFQLTLNDESLRGILDCGFRGDNLTFATVASQILLREQPITLRGLMYRLVSAGWLPDTSRKSYSRLSRVMVRLRDTGLIPFSWLVDGVRSTIKPSSWAGITQFVETVRDAYRLDFWASLPEYVHIIAEKDAIAGVLSPVTREYDVALSPIRGYCSLSFVHEIATTWNRTQKPVFAYYLGDYDASGFDLERDCREKLQRYCTRDFHWVRLGVNEDDFETFGLRELDVKDQDTRAAKFRRQHGDRCAELDALPSTELRQRVRDAITSHIPMDEWEKLQHTEAVELETFNATIGRLTANRQ